MYPSSTTRNARTPRPAGTGKEAPQMTKSSVPRPGFARRICLALAASASLLAAGVGLSAVHAQAAPPAQSAPATPAAAPQKPPTSPNTGIVGTWQGTLHVGRDLRIVAKFTNDGGSLKATMFSIDQGGGGIPASSASFADGTLNFAITMIDGKYEGKLSADGKSIAGSWTQGGNSNPLVFERATPETEWAIPEPPPRIPPMAADADPSFEVATIKPTAPGEQRHAFVVQGRSFKTINFSLIGLISISYGVQEKQIVNAPDWMSSERFDIDAEPDVPGQPNKQQLMTMVHKLLADRFQLKFHREKREMSAYVLTVGKAGNKMTKTDAGPNDLPGFGFGPIGTLRVFRANMNDFTEFLQTTVLDRPVVNQTGLDGRWNFILKWTPDESQFVGRGFNIPPPPADSADAPPPLFTAIQEQLGLKMDAEKTPVEVIVIDHIEQPSAN